MGILDAPAKSFKSARLGLFHRKIKAQEQDVNILVVGDSTGAGTTRWPRLIASKIAAAYPTHTVVYKGWDDPSKTYPAGQVVTVQTGTGSRTITLWNGSLSGSAIAYARDNIGTLVSGYTPDLIFFNFGHNSPQLADDYRAIHQETVQIYANSWTNAAIVLMTQNPRATSDAAYADDQGKQAAIYGLAALAGHDIVDINQAFRDYGPNYATDLLLPDGLHPNDNAGSPLWADKVWDAIKPSKVTLPAGAQGLPTRIWVPASQFVANQGTPTLANHQGIPVWELDAATQESVSTVVDIPSSWDKQNIRAIWTVDTAGTSVSVVWTAEHMYVGSISGYGGGVTIGTWSASGGATQGPSGFTAGKTVQTDVWQRTSLGASPVGLRIGRNGAHASDTFTSDALLIGVIIDRAS